MRRAMVLAQRGEGAVNPNPMVGAVIVRGDEVVAEGYHQRYGDLHAERNAFRVADERGLDCHGTTMYVTLEPCCHHGHQPPCTEAVIAHGVRRVVVGLLDPNPLVAGKGIAQLVAAGIEVAALADDEPLHNELLRQNRVFLHYITQRRPWIAAKYAMTLDGKICTRTGESQWITGPEARKRVHQLRKKYSAILCGIGTALADDPMLDTRLEDDPTARCPIRIVLDRQARLPLSSKLATTARKQRTIVVHTAEAPAERLEKLSEQGVETWLCPTLEDMMDRCGQEHIDSILVEGGGTVNEAMLCGGWIDEVYAFVAPKLIGGREAKTPVEGLGLARLSDAMVLHDIEVERCGQDILIHGLKKD